MPRVTDISRLESALDMRNVTLDTRRLRPEKGLHMPTDPFSLPGQFGP